MDDFTVILFVLCRCNLRGILGLEISREARACHLSSRQTQIAPFPSFWIKGRKETVKETTWTFAVSVFEKRRFRPSTQHHLAYAFSNFSTVKTVFEKFRFQ